MVFFIHLNIISHLILHFFFTPVSTSLRHVPASHHNTFLSNSKDRRLEEKQWQRKISAAPSKMHIFQPCLVFWLFCHLRLHFFSLNWHQLYLWTIIVAEKTVIKRQIWRERTTLRLLFDLYRLWNILPVPSKCLSSPNIYPHAHTFALWDQCSKLANRRLSFILPLQSKQEGSRPKETWREKLRDVLPTFLPIY